MATVGPRDVQVTVGGKAYTLRYGVTALEALRQHWQLPDLNACAERFGKMGGDPSRGIAPSFTLDDLIGIFWAGLRRHHRDISKDQAEEIIDDAGLSALHDLAEQFTEAFAASLPPARSEAGQGGEPSEGAGPT